VSKPSYSISKTKKYVKTFIKLPADVQARVDKSINSDLVPNPYKYKLLKGQYAKLGIHTFGVDAYRIEYMIEEPERLIKLLLVFHRSEGYR
jgi:mRNA-degrading endonuclease RelE of RelBE toxin-antitoxin system